MTFTWWGTSHMNDDDFSVKMTLIQHRIAITTKLSRWKSQLWKVSMLLVMLRWLNRPRTDDYITGLNKVIYRAVIHNAQRMGHLLGTWVASQCLYDSFQQSRQDQITKETRRSLCHFWIHLEASMHCKWGLTMWMKLHSFFNKKDWGWRTGYD